MAFASVVGDVAEVVMAGTMAAGGSNAKNVQSVFHYRLSVLGAAPTKAALEAIFQTTICVPFVAAANVRYTQSGNSVRCVNDATDAYQTVARALPGAIATDSMPTVDSVFMLLRTAKRGASYRGSKHFPGVNESDTTDDILTGAGLVRWQALQTALPTALVDALGNTWVLSLLSRTLSQLSQNPTTVVANDVTSVLLNKNVGTMRRRRTQTVR